MEDTKLKILNTAVRMTTANPTEKLIRDDVAKAAGVSTGLISYHFGSIAELRKEVMREAVRGKILSILAYGLMSKNPIAMSMSSKLRKQVAKCIATINT